MQFLLLLLNKDRGTETHNSVRNGENTGRKSFILNVPSLVRDMMLAGKPYSSLFVVGMFGIPLHLSCTRKMGRAYVSGIHWLATSLGMWV